MSAEKRRAVLVLSALLALGAAAVVTDHLVKSGASAAERPQ